MLGEDLAAYLVDFGVTATWTPANGGGGSSDTVLFQAPDSQLLGGMAISREYRMAFRSTSFVGIRHGDAVAISASPVANQNRDYLVRTVESIDDGAFLEAVLEHD